MNQEKLSFLKNNFLPLIKKIPADTKGSWGRMNGQQMVEHVCDFFKISSGKLNYPLAVPAEHLPKYKAFLLSEKEFRENTKAPVLPDEPLPVRHVSINESLTELESEVNGFFGYFRDDSEKKTLHPAFGELNFAEWVQLHHKHVKHHLKQFGIII